MSLATGQYSIRSAAFSQPFIDSETSGNLRKVISLPQNDPPAQWDIENIGNGRYLLKTRGNPTAVIDDLVFAIPSSSPPAEKWELQQLPQYGTNQYLIQTNNDTAGWVLPLSFPFTQVETRALTVQSGDSQDDSPQYAPEERWIIESLQNLD